VAHDSTFPRLLITHADLRVGSVGRSVVSYVLSPWYRRDEIITANPQPGRQAISEASSMR